MSSWLIAHHLQSSTSSPWQTAGAFSKRQILVTPSDFLTPSASSHASMTLRAVPGCAGRSALLPMRSAAPRVANITDRVALAAQDGRYGHRKGTDTPNATALAAP